MRVCGVTWKLFVCACNGRDLYVRVSGGFSSNDTSWAISAIVRVWKLPILLVFISITSSYSRPLLCSCIACLSGAYIVCMWSMISDMFCVWSIYTLLVEGIFVL